MWAVPNKDFWTSLPAYIQRGARFAFVEWFGLRSTSQGYEAAKLDGGAGYGTVF